MNDQDHDDTLARIDERTKNMKESLDRIATIHGERIRSLERDRNILYGAWVAIAALFGVHVKGGG